MTRKTKNKYNHYTEGFRREAVRRSETADGTDLFFYTIATSAEGQGTPNLTPAHTYCGSLGA